MIDIQYIRDNPDLVKQKSLQKGYNVDIDELLRLDTDRINLLQQVESLRQRRNENADAIKMAGQPSQELIDTGKQIKLELSSRDLLLEESTKRLNDILVNVPNMHFEDVPIGDESASVEIKKFGDTPTGATDHLELAEKREWVDFDRGAKVAGSKFYYLKGDLALLENALIQYAISVVTSKGFTYMTVPHMVNSRIETGTGFAPRSSDQSDDYYIEGEDLALIATAEIPLTGYRADEIIEEKDTPLLYAGLSPCYRKEAGTYGKHTRGLFRVHQFNKLEMYAFTVPEKSKEMHEKILYIEEEMWQALEIPYHIINIASGDPGAPAAKKYDIEYWSSVDNKYRELTSCSNCTDYQTRNLSIRVRRQDGRVELLHSLNGTAVSTARSLVAILEHYQNADGSVRVPAVLQPFMSGKELI